MIVNDWQAGKLLDQPSLCSTLRLNFVSPESLQVYNEKLIETLDILYWRILRLEKELDAMKARTSGDR